MPSRSDVLGRPALAVVLAALWTISAPAADVPVHDPPALTLAECHRLALRQSEELKLRSERIDQAEARVRQALGSVLPRLNLSASEFYQDTGGGSDAAAGSNLTRSERPEMRFTLRQPLFSGFREFAAMASFKADRRKEEHLRDRASKLLFLDVARAFYLVVRIDKDMENLDAFTDLTRERVRELETRERLGKSRRSEILNAESQLETAQAQKAQLGGDRAAAAELLSFLTGIDAARAVLKDGLEEVAPFDSEEGFLARAGGRSDVRAQEREIESARQEVRLARGAFYPSAGFLGNYYAKRVGTQRNIDWDALFSVDLPLFQGGTARALVREAGSRLKESELRLQELRRDIRREVREAARRVNASVAGSKRLRSAFEKAAESYRLQVGEYRLGLVNNLEVLQVMNDMQDRKRDLDRALIESKVHWLELKTAAEDLPEAP